jgi:hypothetical protein
VGAYVSQTYTHLEVTAQQFVNGGTAFSFTVAAVDQYNNLLSNFTGTVQFSSSDANATLPAAYPFTAADQGVHTFTATLQTGGSQTITATGPVNPDGVSSAGSATLSVTPSLVVTNTNDSGYGSLRWAVAQANASATPATITFGSLFGTPRRSRSRAARSS